MPEAELRIGNRTAYFRKAISEPLFSTDSVLTRNAWNYVELWLRRRGKTGQVALDYWTQARDFHEASLRLPPVSAPLTLYYCFLNATKALLTIKGVAFAERHGVAGPRAMPSNRNLATESTTIGNRGIVSELVALLKEPEASRTHTLRDMIGNLPFIHRAFCLTYGIREEKFIPLRNPLYVLDTTAQEVRFRADIAGRSADKRRLSSVLAEFPIISGEHGKKYTIRSTAASKWVKRGSSKIDRENATTSLRKIHSSLRLNISFISAPLDLWYLKRNVAGIPTIDRYGLTLIIASMHRLSELSRYDPRGLDKHLKGRENWLLTEFINLAPSQFVDEIACEMTGLEFRLPGVRP
jgi:YaaC-like Protein